MDVELNDYRPKTNDRLAIEIKDAFKCYSKDTFVLRGFNMSVRKGSIYGLLGPSGCGKTTLLNCIVGRCVLDAGEIKLLVTKRSEIGYMPQDVSLYKEFSIWETFLYFGKLYKIPSRQLARQIEDLKCLLNLPSLKTQCGNLSGGQQRRVSFAVVLLHNPQLLILDEPTVGVDPVLSASIWTYLLQLSETGKTIVITTHYIEEAKQAHCIGLMRDGVLLAEDSPNNLMMKNDSPTLENAFLVLSLKQHEDSANGNFESPFPLKKNKTSKVVLESKEICDVPRMKAQLLKQYYWTKRNIGGMLFTIFLPVVVLLIFNFSMGHRPKNISIAVVNYELLSNCSSCAVKFVSNCPENFLSCRYLKHLGRYDLELKSYKNLNEAYMAVKENRVWGTIEFPPNFTASLMDRIELGREITTFTEQTSRPYITMDKSSYVVNWLLYQDFYNSYDKFITEVLRNLNITEQLLKIPIRFEKPVYTKLEIVDNAVAAILVMCIFYFPFIFTSSAVVMEKKQGLMERSMIAGVTGTEVFLSHMVIQVIMLLIQLIVMVAVQFYIFHFPVNSSLFLPATLLFIEGLCGTFFGFSAGFLCESQITITLFGIGTIVPQFFISGMLWPLEGMDPILRAISVLLPLTLPVNALRMMLVKDWGLLNQAVYPAFVCVLVWTIFFFILSSLGLKYKKSFKIAK